MADDRGREMPTVPTSRLDGWMRTDASSETVFRLPTAKVVGHTLVYEDSDLRTAVREATDGAVDRMWRFFFATRLAFSPPLPPAIGPMAVFSTVASEADDEFQHILTERGFRSVSKGRRERIRTESGDRARLRRYTATLDVAGPAGEDLSLDIAGLLAVWTTGGSFRLAGGAYPRESLGAFLDVEDSRLETETDAYQTDLLRLIRGVR